MKLFKVFDIEEIEKGIAEKVENFSRGDFEELLISIDNLYSESQVALKYQKGSLIDEELLPNDFSTLEEYNNWHYNQSLFKACDEVLEDFDIESNEVVYITIDF